MKKLALVSLVLALALPGVSDDRIAALTHAVEQLTGWTAGELKAGLDRLDRLYQGDMRTKEGRARWHGKIVATEYRTNDLVRIDRHEDGYEHREAFKPSSVPPVKAQLSAAERKLRAEQAKAERNAARLKQLEEHFEDEVAALMKAKSWPEDLARLYLQNELAKLAPVKVVNAEIKPEK